MWNFYPWGKGNRSVLGNLLNNYIGSGWWTCGLGAGNGPNRTTAHNEGCRGGCGCLLFLVLVGLFVLMAIAIGFAVVLDELGAA